MEQSWNKENNKQNKIKTEGLMFEVDVQLSVFITFTVDKPIIWLENYLKDYKIVQ